jgi:uncharacterized surface protein with fasciclin (FAS1) repeats
VDLAVATPDLSTLVAAIKAAGLVAVLSGKGPFTVFAPTNEAFAALNRTGALTNLLKPENNAQLVDVLTYHVVPGDCAYPIGHGDKDLPIPPNCRVVRTVEGQNITAKVCSQSCGRQGRNRCKHVCLGTGNRKPVNLQVTPVVASNGIVYIIDAVLTPPPRATIVDLAVATPELSTLVAAIKAAGLVAALSGKGPFTVFAPTNEAFAALPAGVLANLLKPENRAQLVDVLTYHLVAGDVHAKDITDGEMVKTEEGRDVKARVDGSNIFINSAKVTTANVDAGNGVVHIIDTVLSPPSGPAPTPPGSNHLYFRGFTGPDPELCGDVDAAPRLPAAIFEPGNFAALQEYKDITIKLFEVTNGRFEFGVSMEVGRCADLYAPGGPRWTRPAGTRKVDWSPAGLMDGICAEKCNCNFRNGNQTSLPRCIDEPDDPAAMTWCSLCGPKFNQPIDINLHGCSQQYGRTCSRRRGVYQIASGANSSFLSGILEAPASTVQKSTHKKYH